MTAPHSPASADSSPGTAPDSPSPSAAPDAVPAAPLTLRQEEFCRHYAATGNAAGAARDAGYAEGSARQTGCDLLARPDIAGRVRAIRAAWRAVERNEAQILLGRLEQAWDAAVEQGSASLMIRVVKLQAELSGLDRRGAGRRAGLWPLPREDTLSRPADTEPGPLAEAVRRGRHRTERALAAHRASRKALERRKDFDEADWLATARRLPTQRTRPGGPPPDVPAMTEPDISLRGSLQESAEGAGPDAADPAEPDISLHRAGLMPADGDGEPAFDERAWRDDPRAEMARIDAEGRPYTEREMQAYRARVHGLVNEARRQPRTVPWGRERNRTS